MSCAGELREETADIGTSWRLERTGQTVNLLGGSGMNEMLDLKLVLLRGESHGPIEMDGLGRSSRLRMQLQKKGPNCQTGWR